jgi:hypothetical protein
MNFQPYLAEKVMRGEKTVTRRLVSDNPRSPWSRERCGLREGREYAVCPGRGKHAIGRVRIVSIRQERLGRLDTADARREGFAGGTEFVAAFEAINGSADPEARVWRVEFEAVSREAD